LAEAALQLSFWSMANAASETLIAERFARWFSETTGRPYTIQRGDDPPDFLMEPGTWLELSDIFLTNEQAKFEYGRGGNRFKIGMCDPNAPPDPASSPDQLALRLLSKLDEKLAKTSYRRIHEQRGQGVLLLTCEDFFFDQVNLARVEEALACFNPTNDQGFFRLAYFEYCVPAAERVYRKVYPRGGAMP
jgi:hypothetical protein